MIELPWFYTIICLGLGIIIGAWLSKLPKEKNSSLEILEDDIEALNEIEFLSPEEMDIKKNNKKAIPWQVVDYGVNHILKEIIKARFEPEIIVGIGRGGGVVAALIAGNLGNKPITIIDRNLHYKNGKVITQLNETPQIVRDSRKILLVIGGPSSGRVILEVAQKISKEIPHKSEIKTVNLFEKQPIVYAADFKYKTFKVKIRPPWQIKEEYKAFGGLD